MRRMFSLKQLQEIADARINALVEGGTLDNAKPIYCHPLELAKSGTLVGTALVMNNTSTPIDTWDKLKDSIISFGNVGGYARLHIAGGYWVDSELYILAEIAYNYNEEKFYIVAMKAITGGVSNLNITSLTGITVVDSVNKIN